MFREIERILIAEKAKIEKSQLAIDAADLIKEAFKDTESVIFTLDSLINNSGDK